MNSAIEKICYEYSGFERLEKIWETAYSQGIEDERARVFGIVISKADEAQEKQFEIAYHLRAIASEIERSEAL